MAQGEEKWLYEYSTQNYMDINNPEVRKAKKELLKQGYSKTKRAFEIVWVSLTVILLPLAMLNLVYNMVAINISAVILGLIIGILFADFMSGLVHWSADTWGTLEAPFFGPTFIRSFREHHVSPTAMCEHDWIETNGDNCMLVVLPLFLLATKNLTNEETFPSWWTTLSYSFWLSATLGIAFTNQFHKWAHTYHPPSFVSFLQKYRIILPKENHIAHHRPAFEGYYCITTGWLNPILDGIGFWRVVERVVTKLTGMIPREDDWKWTGLVPATPDIVNKFMEKSS